jgi:hypothetical protein
MKKKKIKPLKKIKHFEASGWNTTDLDEIARRQYRGQTEKFRIRNVGSDPYFSEFEVHSLESTSCYRVEIRSLGDQINSCDCPDYSNNELGTCKHIEHVLFRLQKKGVKLFKHTEAVGSHFTEIYLDQRDKQIYVSWSKKTKESVRVGLSPFFSAENKLRGDPLLTYKKLMLFITEQLKRLQRYVRVSRHISSFIEYQTRLRERQSAKEIFLKDVNAGKKRLDVVQFPLYPYQKEGMLHLAFTERALLADEMGLGKTVQAIAACELLRKYKNVKRVLVVATASLKTEWEEQIDKFTQSSSMIVVGTRANRLKQYQQPAFFYLTNYEQIVMDKAAIQDILQPDVIILDEAQRIKNWQTKAAQAVKQLKSRYAFVLTGTPLENRIDDIYSIVQFLDPHVFGALFRFNRKFYQVDEKGRATGYKNLDELHQKVCTLMLRRLKQEVEGQLPDRTVNTFFVKMEQEQRDRYDEYKSRVARLVMQSKRRPLSPDEFKKMQMWLSCMRMLCDTPYILDPDCQISPKLSELKKILSEVLLDKTAKILIFSEWERMLQLVRNMLEKQKISIAWHTGSVPQQKRRLEIKRFKEDPLCRIFLSTDSGSVGLNLQNANFVINLDLPWNPAKLEQRIARAWRKHQTRKVQVIYLVCEESIEHQMLGLLAKKQTLAQGVLDGTDDLREMVLPSGRAAFLDRMEQLMAEKSLNEKPQPASPPLQEYQNPTSGERTLFVVADLEQREQIEKKLQSSDNPMPHLEVISPDVFATIQRLAEAGVLVIQSPEKIWQNPEAFTLPIKKLSEKQIEDMRQLLSLAGRKQQMSQVLIDNDFLQESLAAIKAALEATVEAFLYISSSKKTEEITDDLLWIENTLIKEHGFPSAVLELLQGLHQDAALIHPGPVRHLLALQESIFKYVNQECKRHSDVGAKMKEIANKEVAILKYD